MFLSIQKTHRNSAKFHPISYSLKGEHTYIGMGEGGVVAAMLVVPPKNTSKEAFLQGVGDDVTPSPTTFVSSLFAENDPYPDVKPFGSPVFPHVGGEQGLMRNASNKGTTNSDHLDEDSEENLSMNGNGAVPHIPSNKIARYKSMMPSRLPIPSACLTIPPGLSPTMLLESPILFCPGLADPSPTTSFLASLNNLGNRLVTGSGKNSENQAPQNDDNFIFRPHSILAKSGCSPTTGTGSLRISSNADSETENRSILNSEPSFMYVKTEDLHETNEREGTQTAEPNKKHTETEAILSHHGVSMNGKPSSDGYNWKKYGQKQLKGTERPRSYYKCTHPNCTVKKHVEYSEEGEITEITYKGEHNHLKPQTTRRASRNAPQLMVDRSERGSHLQSNEDGLEKVESDRHQADMPSSSVVISHTGMIGTPEQSFCSPSDEDNCDDEQESKRRRMENGGEMPPSYPPPIRTIREPRVVVQTVSQVDILDDGYRWRKYGQKVVKGHTYPRNYYKCTNVGCGVRKHIERSSSDPRSVKTTYEGKHNHDVPSIRGRGSA